MMEGKRPDARFLQQLQEAAGGAAMLLKCLRWMALQVDQSWGIKKYAFSEKRPSFANGRNPVLVPLSAADFLM